MFSFFFFLVRLPSCSEHMFESILTTSTLPFISILHCRYYEYHILGKFQAAAVEHAEQVE